MPNRIKIFFIFLVPVVLIWTGLSVVVEIEQESRKESLLSGSAGKALIIYHPSWLDHFQEGLTQAFAEGLGQEGWSAYQIRSFWLWRPNDESRMKEPNREVA